MEDVASAQDLCRRIFATLREYTDKASCLAVERAIDAALETSPAFLKAFAGLVAKAAEKQNVGRRQRLTLIRWSCLVMAHLDPATFEAGFVKIAQVQGALLANDALDRDPSSDKTVGGRPCGPFQRLLRRRPELVPAYLERLGEGSGSFVAAAPLAACGLSAELLVHVSRHVSIPPPSARRAGRAPKNRSKAPDQSRGLGEAVHLVAREAAMLAYTRVVFGGDAKSKLPPTVGQLFIPLVSTLTHEEFNDRVMPIVVKQLRRSPDLVLRSTRSLFTATTIDLSRYAAALLEPLASQMKHADAWRRAEAVAAVAAIARSSTDVDAVRGIFENHIKAELEDPKRRPKEWTARVGLAEALKGLSHATASEKAMSALAGEVCACLATVCKNEAQKDARGAAVAALGAWLVRLPTALPQETVEAATAGMKDTKDGHHRALLRMLVGAIEANRGLAAGGALLPLVKHLAPLAKTGAAKPSQRAEGAMALYVIAAAAAADDAAMKEATKEGVWTDAIKPDATYFNPSAVAKLGADDSETLARTLGQLLGHAPLVAHLAKAKSAEVARRTTTLLLLHPTSTVRAAAQRAMDAAMENGGIPPGHLLAALKHWVHEAEEGSWPGLSPEEGEVTDAPAAFPSRLAGAALAGFCDETTGAVPLGLAGSLLLLAHHPLVAAPDGRREGAWGALLARLDARAARARAASPTEGVRAQVSAACEVIAGEEGLGSAREADRDAAISAAYAAARLAPDVALDALLPVAESLASTAEHRAVDENPEKVKIFACLPGKLSTDPVDVFKRVEAGRSDPNPNGTKGRDASDDDAPSQVISLRPSQAAAAAAAGKSKAKAGAGNNAAPDKAELARRAQFADEAKTRAEVRDVVDRTTRRLRLTAALLRGGTRRGAAAARVPSLATEILPLLNSTVLPPEPVLEAAAAMVVAAAAVPGNAASCLAFPDVPRAMAAALRISAAYAAGSVPKTSDDDDAVPSSNPARVAADTATLAAALDAAVEAVEMNDEEPLPPAALALLFPLCSRALLLPDGGGSGAVKKAAMHILAAHAAASVEGLPRAATARLLLTVMATGTAQLAAAAHPLLLDVAAWVASTSDADEDEISAAARELRRGVESPFRAVRAAALAALLAAAPAGIDGDADGTAKTVVFLARHDADEANRAAAEAVWEAHGLTEDDACIPESVEILPFLSHEAAAVRDAAVGAFAAAVAARSSAGVAPVLAKLFAAFAANAPKAIEPAAASEDPFAGALIDRKRPTGSTFQKGMGGPGGGLPPTSRTPGNPQAREAIMRALGAVAPSLTARDLPLVSTFLTKVLGDEEEAVRDAAMAGGKTMIERHGAEHVRQLLSVYEGYFDRQATGNSGQSEAQSDNVRQGVVVFLGALACHLDKEDPKIRQILARLVAVLSTPSEAVQRSVADCLPPLMPSLNEEERRALVESLLAQVTAGEGYAERRGAAFGLAGAVKGMGIGSLKGFGVMDAIKAAVEDKKNPDAREGAVMAFELLCRRLGRLFEPYVIHVLPMLLVCFGDQNAHVRDATVSASRAVMAQLSAQGVKLVLPAIMKGLEDKAWRTKQGSVQLLGAMSSCAPKQLSACLPQIVPRLSETLIDTHPKVVEAATHALKAIGDVIRNPEIEALSSYLLGAIAKPAERTLPCLDVLLETTFVNTVDAPSLALIVPVLDRGLRDRKADLKKKAAKIAGNMCALVADAKDMSPYISILLPEIQKCLVDPSPEVRSTAAAALASLLRGMGGAASLDEHFAELVPWLTSTLQSDGAATERSGAAQGLAECLAVLGAEYFEAMFPEILEGCHHAAPHVREGHLTLLKFLPLAVGELFEAHLQEALMQVLQGLADAAEPVRDAALGAGRIFVEEFSHSQQSLDLLLPAIEEGICSENWRIRQSAVELLGSMMFRIAGTSGKVHVEGGSDDEGISTEAQGRALSSVLGVDRHFDLLAAVYALRSDSTLVVRNSALHIWKTVVSNTPRTLRLILPKLMERLIAGLSADDEDRRAAASRCLGELVRKLGERVLPEIFPILRGGLEDGSPETREGVCLGLAEVLAAAKKEQLEEYYADVVPVVRDALCDEEACVRNAAGHAFDAMFRHGGADTAADIVPALLAKLDTDPVALEGLKQVLKAQPKILASVLPKLASPPINAARASTLGALAEVAGAALPPHLELLFPPLLAAMASEDAEEAEASTSAAAAVIRAVPDEAHYLLLPEILNGVTDGETAPIRAAAAKLCGVFAKEAPCFDEEDDVPQLISVLFELFIDPDEAAVLAAWTALGEVMSCVKKEDHSQYLGDVRKAVDTARERVRRRDRSAREILIPALCLPKGLAPIVQVYLQGVLAGRNADERESAAEGLRDAVLSTTTAAIKPHVIPITGPLIRILGDKYPGAVKSAILGALAVMIDKGGAALKPFVPQLQTTFVKCLSDSNRPVRQRAAAALGRLMTLQPRVDPLVGDLLTALNAAADRGVREATLRALAGVFAHAGKNVGAPNVARARTEMGDVMAAAADEGTRRAAALAMAHVAAWLTDDDRAALVDALGTDDGCDGEEREARAAALGAMARTNPELFLASHAAPILNGLVKAAKDDRVPSRCAAARGLARLAVASAAQVGSACPYLPKLLPVLSRLLRDDGSEVREATSRALKRLCKEHPEAVALHLGAFVPALADVALGDRSKDAKYCAERSLRYALQIYDVPDGLEMAQVVLKAGGAANAARGKLTDPVLRRLKELPDDSDDEDGGGWGSLAADAEDDDVVVLGD